MLERWNAQIRPEGEELNERLRVAREKLMNQQMLMKEKKLPVLVLFEGWGASGKGTTLGSVIRDLDPRFFTSKSMPEPTPDERRKPFLYRYFLEIPEAGQFMFLDEGWMSEVVKERIKGHLTPQQYKNEIGSVLRFQRSLTDNGYLVLKFFFHIEKKEQKKRIKKLLSDPGTAWHVNDFDLEESKHYDEFAEIYDQFLGETDSASSPWYIVDASNRKWSTLQVLEAMVAGIDVALKNNSLTVPLVQNVFPLVKIPKLEDVDLSVSISEEEYDAELRKLQKKLHHLHNEAYLRKIPIVIAYEGWDAAGKGGNIKRLTRGLDPRGYEVFPIASPKPFEKSRHHLWRFWVRLPKTGHFAIFDRTWYGRVMVERLEGFCTENEWQRAYNEINEFEKELADWGAVIIKFWVQIDKDTQLQRFTDRQNTPEKQWKITDEDWRNREKWDLYEVAVNEMLQKTNTTYAPWYILESNDKKYARIKALRIVIEEIEKALDK